MLWCCTYQVKARYETNDEMVANYNKTHSVALKQRIYDGFDISMCNILDKATRNATKICAESRPMNQSSWFQELLKHRFVASPSGLSIDTYFTWDALLAGCIPIVPRSKLAPMFEDLPVWIVDDWAEVTDEAIKEKADEMMNRTYNWDKIFAQGWKTAIEEGLCHLAVDGGQRVTKSTPPFDPLPGPEFTPQEVKLPPIPEGDHFMVPPPEARIGPNGETGYVHDPSFMRKQERSFQIIDHAISCPPPGEGFEEIWGYHNLQRIREHIDMNREKASSRSNAVEQRKVKLMCSVYTYDGRVKHTNAIWETWGKRCDGFFFASSSSNLTTGHTHLPNKSPVQHEYRGIFQKVRTMMTYMYDNFLEDYDFFHFSGDDTFLIVENLREYLGSSEVQSYEAVPGRLLIAGGWLSWGDRLKSDFFNYYLGGGSGYTLSRKALKTLVEGPLQVHQINKKLRASDEDCRISDMFRLGLNVTGIDTRDKFGAHRFHHLGVSVTSDFPRYRIGLVTTNMRKTLEAMLLRRGFPIVYQEDLVSPSSIAFHRMTDDEMRRYEMLLYGTGVDQCRK